MKISQGAALGIMTAAKPNALKYIGGAMDIIWNRAHSFAVRHWAVMRKATKTAKVVLESFEDVKSNFPSLIGNVVKEHNISDELIINIDETGLLIVPVRSYTGNLNFRFHHKNILTHFCFQ